MPDATGEEDDPTWEADPYYAKTCGASIPRWKNARARTGEGFMRGYGFQGTARRLFVEPGRPSQIALMGFGELLPYADNRVTLAKMSDRWGVLIRFFTDTRECPIRTSSAPSGFSSGNTRVNAPRKLADYCSITV